MGSIEYAAGLGRAFVGATLFALPLHMTMEMWQFGFSLPPLRIATWLVCSVPLLIALSHFAGFERTFSLLDDTLDAFAAIAVAMISSVLILAGLGVITAGQPLAEIAGKLALITVPAAIGALLADKQLGEERQTRGDRSYGARLFLMTVGALFVALNVAPTEEMVLISFQLTRRHALALALASLALLHALLFWVDFPGRAQRRGGASSWSIALRQSLAGYALCLLISLYLLWIFARTDGVSISRIVEFAVVLGFPAAIGAGLAPIVIDERRG